MKNSKSTFILLLILIFPVCLKAHNLQEVRLEEYRKLMEDRMSDFQNYIFIITNKSLSIEERREAAEQARSLFFEGAKMQVIGRHNTTKRVPIDGYLNSLLSLNQYDKVEIKNCEVLLITNFKKGVDGNYHATETIFQKFDGFDKNGKAIYADKTSKDISVKGTVSNQAMKSDDIKIFLGDIIVHEATPLINN